MLVASFLSVPLGGGTAFGAAKACEGAAGFGAGAVTLAGAPALTRFFGGATRLFRETALAFRALLAGGFAARFAAAPRRVFRPAPFPLGLGI
jgi:hypothetical protein